MKSLSRLFRTKGFTLIELMIVVAVIGILIAIALPSYREQIAKGQRATAKAVLTEAQQWLERFYSENYRYNTSLTGVGINDASLFPAQFTVAPKPGEGNASYSITVSATTYTYSLTASVTGNMVGDRCGNYNITQTGRKSVVSYSTTVYPTALAAARDCWK